MSKSRGGSTKMYFSIFKENPDSDEVALSQEQLYQRFFLALEYLKTGDYAGLAHAITVNKLLDNNETENSVREVLREIVETGRCENEDEARILLGAKDFVGQSSQAPKDSYDPYFGPVDENGHAEYKTTAAVKPKLSVLPRGTHFRFRVGLEEKDEVQPTDTAQAVKPKFCAIL